MVDHKNDHVILSDHKNHELTSIKTCWVYSSLEFKERLLYFLSHDLLKISPETLLLIFSFFSPNSETLQFAFDLT